MQITMTESAVSRIYALMEADGDFTLGLRLYITGGGCSGFQYGFGFEKVEDLSENVWSQEHQSATIRLLVDPISAQYLEGATVDYTQGLQGAKFVVNNPTAKTTCGCGSSFTI